MFVFSSTFPRAQIHQPAVPAHKPLHPLHRGDRWRQVAQQVQACRNQSRQDYSFAWTAFERLSPSTGTSRTQRI